MEENQRTYSSVFTLLKYSYRSGLSEVEKKLYEQYAKERTLSVLDLGVGAGRTSGYFLEFPHYRGIDYSSVMIDWCRKRFGDPSGTRFMHGDARMLPFRDETFDLTIFSFNGIDYVSAPDRERILGEVRRVLKHGGVFLFSTHSIHSLSNRTDRFEGVFRWLSDHWRAFLIRRLNRGTDLKELSKRSRTVVRDMPTLRTHYISVGAQAEELNRAGFRTCSITDEDGSSLLVGDELRVSAGKWFYVVAAKP